jgi:hypothetical protein
MKKARIAAVLGFFLIANLAAAQVQMPGVNLQAAKNVPLGVILGDSTNLEFLNKALGPTDLAIVGLQAMNLLSAVTSARKGLFFAEQDFSQAATFIDQAKNLGASLIGFIPDGQMTRDELVARIKEVADIVKNDDLKFMLAPKIADLEKYPLLFARASVLLFPSQKFQTQPNYKAAVGVWIARIKKTNPSIRVWVQVSANPAQNVVLTPDQVLRNIAAIADVADGILLSYSQAHWDVAKAVILKLRNSGKISR